MTTPVPERLPRWPFVLLGLMTLATFGGPVLIGSVLKGGERISWPPDRPIEWATVIGTSGLVLVLMLACLSLSLRNRKALAPSSSPLPPGEGPGVRGVAQPVTRIEGSSEPRETPNAPHPGPFPGGEEGRGSLRRSGVEP